MQTLHTYRLTVSIFHVSTLTLAFSTKAGVPKGKVKEMRAVDSKIQSMSTLDFGA